MYPFLLLIFVDVFLDLLAGPTKVRLFVFYNTLYNSYIRILFCIFDLIK